MTYKVMQPEKIIKICCNLREYKTKDFKAFLENAFSDNPDKIVIEINNDKKGRMSNG